MKTYANGMKTTEFTKKQINVIYSMAKQEKLQIEKWYMSNLYDLADYYNYDSNGSVEFEERFILNILRNVFEGNLEEAQKLITSETNRVFDLISTKRSKDFDRGLVK